MKNSRKEFLKKTGLVGIGLAGGGVFKNLSSAITKPGLTNSLNNTLTGSSIQNEVNISVIGSYGQWAASMIEKELPEMSFRRDEWKEIETWQKAAKKQYINRLAIPDIGSAPEVHVVENYIYDGLHIEELRWQLPYGMPTEALLLKPANSEGRLPGILAFHDHGANKYFGRRKITRTKDDNHPDIDTHQQQYYDGFAWANEIAKKGFTVLVSDAFPFASRRVLMENVSQELRIDFTNDDHEFSENIQAYNDWAAEHEHVMAKSLFSAGTTWPGVFLAEDRIALDILCSREDVDESRVGCGGLSGGGMRSVFIGAMDSRIKCAVCVGFMTTWKDLILANSYKHTWMTYVPLLPKELDFPDVFGLNVPMPSLVLNNEQDELFTLSEMKKADEILKEIYNKAGAGSHYESSFHPGPHKFDRAMQLEAFNWFEKWLKK